MKKLLTKARMTFMQTCPRTYIKLSKFVSQYMFPETTRLLKGKSQSPIARPSAIFFGHNRCATRFLSGCFVQLCQSEGRPTIDLETYFARTDGSKGLQLNDPEFLGKHFRPQGYYYGPHYWYRPLPDFSPFKILLTLRDPRDVITSRYYSQGFAHTLMDEKALERRRYIQQQTVDEFVKENTYEVRNAYQGYLDNLIHLPNVLYMSYEEMITDFPTYLDKAITHLELQPTQKALDRVIASSNFSVTKEDIYAHKRSVKPGSHLRKLQPETIDFVNQEFSSVLETLHYPKTSATSSTA